MKRWGKPAATKENPNSEYLERLRLLAETSLRINQMETSQEVADLLCQQVKAIIGKGYVAVSLVDDATQILSVKAMQGLEDDGIINAGLRLSGTDPRKIQMPITGFTQDELAIYTSGHLELLKDGIYELLSRKYPRPVCSALEHLLDVRFVYTMGFVHRGQHIGGIGILTGSQSVVESSKFFIESATAQSAAIISRLTTEEHLRESEARYRLLFENMEEGFSLNEIITDEKGNPVDFRILDANSAYERNSGLKFKEIAGKTIREIMPNVDPLQIINYGRVALTGVPEAYEYYSKTFKRHFRVHVFCPQTGRFATTFEDITERKQVEQALAKSESLYHDTFDNAPLGLFHSTEDGKFIFVNSSLARMLGFETPAEMISVVNKTSIQQALYVDPQKRARLIADNINTPGWAYSENEYWRTDGSIITARLMVRFVKNPDGTIDHIEGMVEDITDRLKAERALATSEEHFRTVVETAIDGYWLADTKGNLLEVNDAYCRMSGYTREELLAMPLPALEVEANLDQTIARIQKLIEEGQDRFETRHRRKDGGTIDLEVSVQYRPDHGGRMVVFLRDITERKKVGDALAREEAHYRSLVNGIPGIVYSFSLKRGGLYYSPQVMQILGYSSEQLIAQPKLWNNSIHVDDVQMVQQAIREAGSGKPFVVEYRIRDAFGNWHWFIDRSFGYADVNGDMLLEGLALDITERKKAEDTLYSSRQLLEEVINSLPARVFWKDRDLVYLGCNTLFARDAGFTDPNDIIGKDDFQMAWGEYGENYRDDDRQVIESGAPKLLIEEPYKNANGDIKVILTSKIPLRNAAGEITGLLGTFIDITDRKKAEEKIKASLAEKVVILKEIHHRVKNNMQVISSLLHLQSGFVKDQRDALMFQESQRRIYSMSLVYNKLYQSDDLANISFNEYVTELVDSLVKAYHFSTDTIKTLIDVKDIQLGLDFAVPCGLIINEVITNSLKHAFPAGKAGQIRVIIRKTESRIEMLLGDDGIGLPEGLTFGSTNSLGMVLVQTLAENQLGGKLELKRGNGTEYLISFPYKPL